MAVLPELRYDYSGEIRAGALARLWLFLGRIIRPDPESFFPAMLRLDPRASLSRSRGSSSRRHSRHWREASTH